MKTLLFSIILIASINFLHAQDKLIGKWLGTFNSNGFEVKFVMKISKTDSLPLILSCPTIGKPYLEIEKLKLKKDSVKFSIKEMNSVFSGVLTNDSTISGTLSQSIFKQELVFHKREKVPECTRTQTPVAPFPYKSQDVSFINKVTGNKLAGTLTIPENSHNAPVVILITGSGPQNRDEEIFGHKPFWVIADYLTRRGIAVLRYDDRGIGKSEGVFSTATSRDFASDALAAIEYVKNNKSLNSGNIGLMGHSEGGLIASMIAGEHPDLVNFVVLLAGPSLPGDKIIQLQSKMILESTNEDKDYIEKSYEMNVQIHKIIKKTKNNDKAIKKMLKKYEKFTAGMSEEEKTKKGLNETTLRMSLSQATSPWFRFFLAYDPAENIGKIKCPFLALNGTKDVQVPQKENFEKFEEVFKKAGKTNYKLIAMEGMNHLFQKCSTCQVSEYGELNETFSEETLKVVCDWIKGN